MPGTFLLHAGNAPCSDGATAGRRVKLQASTGKASSHKKCCDECTGHWKKPWLNSGDLMYFNRPWNRSWTHGIPKHDFEADGVIGPRISIALLCAERAESCSLDLVPKSKVISFLPK